MKQLKFKKLFSALLTVCMTLSLMPAMTLTALADTPYSSYMQTGNDDFGTLSEGYGVQSPREFSFTFYGLTVSEISGITATLEKGDSSAFEITAQPSPSTIVNNDSDNKFTFSVRPKTELGVGTHTDKLFFRGSHNYEEDITLKVIVDDDTYTCSIAPEDHTFAKQYPDYDNTSLAQEFTLTNTGTGQLTGLSAALAQGGSSSFEISSPLSPTTVASPGTATVSVRPKSGLSSGTYTDTLKFAGGNLTEASVPLSFTVRQNPEITKQASDQSINAGGTASFTVEANGDPEPTYQWYVSTNGGSNWTTLSDSGYYSGTATQTLTVAGVPSAYNGYQYQCRVQSGLYSITPRTATLTVTDGGTGALTGTMEIGGQNIPLAISRSGSGWSWNAATATLTLNSSYPSDKHIKIECDQSDNINLVLTGDVTIQEGSSFVLYCYGNLNIKAGNYTLDLSSTTFWCALVADGNLVIESGTIIATGADETNAIQVTGDVTISGSANVTAISLGGSGFWGASGIKSNGDVHITTSGKVDTSGLKNGIYAESGITISNGTVTAAGTDPAALIGASSGVTVTGGTLITGGTLTPDRTNGDVWGGLTVSGASTNVTVNGNIKHQRHWEAPYDIISPGDLTVSGGTVTVTGTIDGIQKLTGGTVIVGGSLVFPAGSTLVNWDNLIANGIANHTNTTELTLTFGADPAGLTVDDITVTGATKGTLSGTGSTRTLTISNITVAEGENVIVTITKNPASLAIIPLSKTVAVHKEAASSPTGGGSGGGGSSAPAASSLTVSGTTATTTVTPSVTNGTANASVSQSQMSEALSVAQKAAKGSGEKPQVEIKLENTTGVSSAAAAIPQSAMQALVSGGAGGLTVSSGIASATFGEEALAAISGAASGDVMVSASRVDISTLPAAAQTLVGNRPVYEFRVTSGGNTISQFSGGVTVSVPYTLGAGEDPNAVIVSYINTGGDLETVMNGRYDAATGTVIFTTTHFSRYAVGYNRVDFTDVADSNWCADAVTFLSARGITGGTSETTFSPDATLTRGQFITLLLRAYDVEADKNSFDNFSDAGNTYYTGYLAATKRLGISSGVGDNKFAPGHAITRQQMFTLLYNALNVLDKLPDVNSGKTLSDFTDSGSIASYAQESMTRLVESGVIGGSNGYLFPKSTTTRAQMAQVLYHLLSE